MTSARRDKATCDVSTAGERGVKQIEGTAEQRQVLRILTSDATHHSRSHILVDAVV